MLTGTTHAVISNHPPTRVQRAALSHRIRRIDVAGQGPFLVDDIQLFEKARLPTPAEQLTNALVYIGDYVASSGAELHSLPVEWQAIIGAASPSFADDIVKELLKEGQSLVQANWRRGAVNGPLAFHDLKPTFAGWERYEAEKKGRFAGQYGFLAFKFQDPAVMKLKMDAILPATAGIGFEVVDMNDLSRAGLIDNLMREQIRDAAFVLAELSHDNNGAYWEAGYAEGLGKPVIYLCEKSKFEETNTHFDTNHCTTVKWSLDDLDDFKKQLAATIRRSLNLFPQ